MTSWELRTLVMKIVLAWNPVPVMKIKHESTRPRPSFSSFADNGPRERERGASQRGQGSQEMRNNPARVKMVVWIKIQNVLIVIKTETRHVAAAGSACARHQGPRVTDLSTNSWVKSRQWDNLIFKASWFDNNIISGGGGWPHYWVAWCCL